MLQFISIMKYEGPLIEFGPGFGGTLNPKSHENMFQKAGLDLTTRTRSKGPQAI